MLVLEKISCLLVTISLKLPSLASCPTCATFVSGMDQLARIVWAFPTALTPMTFATSAVEMDSLAAIV